MKKISVYSQGYQNLLKDKKIDFMSPAENFIRIYKMHLKKKDI